MLKTSAIAVVVSPNQTTHTEIELALGQGSLVQAIWSVSDPELSSLERLKEADPGCVLFLEFSVRSARVGSRLSWAALIRWLALWRFSKTTRRAI